MNERRASDADSAADPRAVIVSGAARFMILTPQLLRLEYAPGGIFEDRASMAFTNRRLPPPEFRRRSRDGWLIVETDGLRLRYREEGGPFTAANLAIDVNVAGGRITWRPDARATGNLRGTARTLDFIDGCCELETGLLSRDGWAVVDDSASCVFDHGDPPWAVARTQPGVIDWYFFGHGREYARALHDYTRIAGRIPLPPRFVFGSWWSRYWAYTDAELRDLVRQFRDHDVPLDVLVIDMDWHLPGWTGYTWDRERFPDPPAFLRWCREQGLKTTLNLHPADGVGRHEDAFAEFARGMGLDPQRIERIAFDCADRRFMRLYFDLLHHPHERTGVDFWWLDWQQARITKIPNLDPLRWLNHLHWHDMQTNPERSDRRPLIFSRWAGLGNHRYPIGFSGDAYSTWPSLAWQPEFTATAGNVGQAYWSHDIGGHLPGPVDGELYVRWIQFGAMSPVLRTHTTKRDDAERRIWAFEPEFFQAARQALHLRQRLVPYIYTMARKCHDTALPLCRPLYYHWPEIDDAYGHPAQYLFGDDLLVAPIVSPRDKQTGLATARLWIPPGQWVNWHGREIIHGPRTLVMHAELADIPIFARAGAIIPMHRDAKPLAMLKPDATLVLRCFPGADGQSSLYDDDGESRGYLRGEFARTSIVCRRQRDWLQLTIDAARGDYPGMPAMRAIEAHVLGVAGAVSVAVNGRSIAPAGSDDGSPGWSHDASAGALIVRLRESPRNQRTRIECRLQP